MTDEMIMEAVKNGDLQQATLLELIGIFLIHTLKGKYSPS